ncbi:polyribonucleotide nucleotidyltransferase 1, mitochondrial isoform X2 [Lepeophtheirus salmonis]
MGNTSVNVTVVSKKSPSSNTSFLPLTVDFRQKSAAAGRIPTNHLRRELGPTAREILISRVIDRSVRPLFPKSYFYETQCVANVIATDGIYDSDVLAINGASAALCVSNIPWNGPIGAVRVGTSNDRKQLIINPTRKERAESSLNLLLAGNIKGEAIVIEADADVLEENIFVDAVEYGLQSCSSIASHIAEWSSNIHQPKRALTYYPSENNTNNEILQSVELLTANKLRNLYESKKHDKIERDSAMFAILENSLPSLKESFPNSNSDIFYSAFYDINKTVISDLIFEDGLRPDGRKPGEMRTLSCEVGLHAPLHGSALFQRGQTQVLCTVALDSIESSLKNDYMSTLTGGIKEKNFFLHYEFPSYATNEISRSFVAGRRELGHGALAEKALMPLIPKNYPFTIRLTSEVLESNGSSSMATVCGGSLALMDAGVDIKSPAAGVAIGLISRKHDSNEEEHTLLLDIIGQEDYVGNMDFKIAGTSEGITALQLDVKIPGLSFDIIKAATSLGLEGIKTVLKTMNSCLSHPKIDKSNLPKIDTITVPINKRSKFIGPSGYNIRRITTNTGVRITPGDSEDTWNIFAHNSEALDEATDLINNSLKEEKEIEFTFGALYKVNVLETNASGIKVQIDPAYPLVYIPNSQLTSNKISHSSAAGIKEGQELLVKCYGRDPVTGNLRLSRKALTVAQSAAVKSISSSSKRSDMIQVQSSSDSLFQAGVSSSNSYDVDKMVVNSRPVRSFLQDCSLNQYIIKQSELDNAKSTINSIEEELKGLSGKMMTIKDTKPESLLSECYLPFLYERYKILIAKRNELNESMISKKTVENKENLKSTSMLSLLVEDKPYKSVITKIENNGIYATICDELLDICIKDIFIANAWLSKKSLDCASVGFKLSLLYRGKDSITNYPRFVEAVSDKDKEKSTQKNTFPTFKPKELFKMDVWSSSSKQNTIKDINRLLSKCSNLSNLRKKEDFLRYFRMQLQYCRNLNPLVSGPLSKIISLEIENEKKDIYFDLECILDTLNSVDSASNVGNKVIKLLNKFVESPYESEIDHEQKSVHMLDLLCSNIRIMEDHVANIVCDKNRIPGQVLVPFEKIDIQRLLKIDQKAIGESIVLLIDKYSELIRMRNLDYLNDWIDYDKLPSFALSRPKIYSIIKDNDNIDSLLDVIIFSNVIENVPIKQYTFLMKQWMNSDFRVNISKMCHNYISAHENIRDKQKKWWKGENSVSSDEIELKAKYAEILRTKNLVKIVSLEIKLLKNVLKVMDLDNELSHKEVDLMLKEVSLGNNTFSDHLLNSVESYRIRVKDCILRHFSS